MNRLFPVLCASVLIGLAGSAAGDAAVGEVRSVKGEVTAQRPGEEPRPLACGDPVYPGDTVRTGAGARVGIQSGDVATQLEADSVLRVDRASGDLPAATLERGKVRMLDPRTSGAPARLAARDVRAEIAGNDAEAYVFAEKVGDYAMLCEWDEDLPVSRGDERETLRPGECVIAKPTEPLYTARAHDARIPMQVAEVCEIDPQRLAALAGDPAKHLSPADVAAPGPIAGIGTAGLGFHNPQGAQMPARMPCDNPGAGCVLPLNLVGPEGPLDTTTGGPGVGSGGL